MGQSIPASTGPMARSANRFLQNRAAIFGLVLLTPLLFAVLTYPLWLPYKPNDIDLMAMNSAPSWKHWFGTDGVGRDVFARTMEGGRISLLVAVSSVVLSTAIGFLIGAISALGGRWADAIAMRSVDLAMTLPPVIFLLVLASIIGSGIWSTVVVIALLSWPVLSRMIRARLLELREREFVMASRGMGAASATSCSATDCPTQSIFSSSMQPCRWPTPSCWKPVSPSLASACRHRRQVGATCSTPPAPPPYWNSSHGNGSSPEARSCWPYWRSTLSVMV